MYQQLIDESDRILTDLISVLDELMRVMKDEHEAIVEYNLLKINELNRKKNDVLMRLQILEKAKSTSFQNLADKLGLKGRPSSGFIISHIPDQELANKLWHKLSCLKSLAQAVQEYNLLEREFIAISMLNVQAELSIVGNLKPEGSCYTKKAELSANQKASMGGMMNQSV